MTIKLSSLAYHLSIGESDFLQRNDRLFRNPALLLPDALLSSYPYAMLFTSESARLAHCKAQGLARARFWRAQGFPNLVRAREARWAGHRKAQGAQDAAIDSPFKLPARPKRGY